MPKGYNADGTKKARPVGSGRKAKGGKKITPKLQQDVIDILAKQRNQASYIEQAVREKFAREQQTKREHDQLARQTELTKQTGQMHLLDVIEEVKQEKQLGAVDEKAKAFFASLRVVPDRDDRLLLPLSI
ncbi:hypothetical protein [Spirosoma pomorum]